jgi:hypothetical protein
MLSLRRSLLSGVGGTLCEAAMTSLERRVWGRPPYDTAAMASRLAGRLGVHLGGDAARGVGVAMRWSYGPAWGVPVELACRRVRWPLAGAAVGAGLFIFELVMLPRSGATPPLEQWGGRFVAADLLNALLFAEVAAAGSSALRHLSSSWSRARQRGSR